MREEKALKLEVRHKGGVMTPMRLFLVAYYWQGLEKVVAGKVEVKEVKLENGVLKLVVGR